MGLSKERLETSSVLNCNDEAGADVAIKFVYLELDIVSNTLSTSIENLSRETLVWTTSFPRERTLETRDIVQTTCDGCCDGHGQL